MKNKKRALIALGLLAGLACLPILILALLPARPGVTQTNFDRIEIGMTQAEVEAILGGPPNHMAPNGRSWAGLLFHCSRGSFTREVWGGNHGGALIEFDAQGRIDAKDWVGEPEGLLGRVRRWLPWMS